MSFLSKMSRTRDMLKSAQEVVDWEKAWLLSQIGLIPDCDDDVMDEVRLSSLLAGNNLVRFIINEYSKNGALVLGYFWGSL